MKEGPDYAASFVSHDDAVAFCGKLTSQEHAAGRLPTDWEYRLPTEAEWEYACRAGTKTTYSFGDNFSQLGIYACFYNNTWDIGEKYAHQVGLKQANAWGLKDMQGNVYELCSDWYDDKLAGGTNPRGPAGGSGRCLRGGCWIEHRAGTFRSAFRLWTAPSFRTDAGGFRVLRSSVK